MEKEKISVIIPVYNLENYIELTLHSVCTQTYKNLEIIVVDDGSTDNSWNLINKCSESDARVIGIHQENKGVTAARLNGINHATGTWIGFVDGDDEIDSDMFEMLINNAYKYQADISHCGYKIIFSDGRINHFYGTKDIREQDNLQGQKDLLIGNPIEPSLCNKLFRKSIVEKADLKANMDLSIKINEDLLMNFLLFQKSRKSVFNDECKYSYIVRKGSSSRQGITQKRIYDHIKVREIILNCIVEELKPYAGKAYLSTCIYIYNILVGAKTKYPEEKNVRNLILKNRKYSKFLNKKQRFSFFLICFCPFFYKQIYKMYSKKVKNNRYH